MTIDPDDLATARTFAREYGLGELADDPRLGNDPKVIRALAAAGRHAGINTTAAMEKLFPSHRQGAVPRAHTPSKLR